MRVLVTGAGGFVGGHLLPLLRTTHDVIDTRFDIMDSAAVRDELAQARPDWVIHLAAVAAPAQAHRDPAYAWNVNLHGTLKVAQAMREVVPDASLLFVGTGDAYGMSFNTGLPLTETAALAPQGTYGATKAAADLALGAMAADGLRLIRARPFNHTGPGQTDAYVVPAFAHQVARIQAGLQEPVIRVGNLDAERDFLDVRDVCAAYMTMLEAGLPTGVILNVASGTPRRVRDVLAHLLRLAGVDAEIRTDPSRIRPSDIPRAIGDASRLRALGWAPVHEWASTLSDILEYFRTRLDDRIPEASS